VASASGEASVRPRAALHGRSRVDQIGLTGFNGHWWEKSPDGRDRELDFELAYSG
jgi:hypothetical protein